MFLFPRWRKCIKKHTPTSGLTLSTKRNPRKTWRRRGEFGTSTSRILNVSELLKTLAELTQAEGCRNEAHRCWKAALNVNGSTVASLPAGGIAPSYLWHSGRTASLRRRPVSYEHKSKKRATDRASVQLRAAPHTNKVYFRHQFLSPSAFLLEKLGQRERVGDVVCSLIVQNHAHLHLYFLFLETFCQKQQLRSCVSRSVASCVLFFLRRWSIKLQLSPQLGSGSNRQKYTNTFFKDGEVLQQHQWENIQVISATTRD